MEHNFLMTDDLLWDYADDLLDAPEAARVAEYLRQQPEWNIRFQAILLEKKELAALPLEAPRAGFAEQVMAAWAAEQAPAQVKAKGTDWTIRFITLIFLLIVSVPVVVMYFSAAELAPNTLPTLQVPELPAIDWAVWANSPVLLYGLLLMTGIWGLRLFDKILQHRSLAQKLA